MVLVSYLIEQIKKHSYRARIRSHTWVYYYCSFRHGHEGRRDETSSFLRWVVSQFCRTVGYVPPNLSALFSQNSTPSIVKLEMALQELLMFFGVFYIVLDAVDESSPRVDLLRCIKKPVTHLDYDKMLLLATSRRYQDIEEMLRPLSGPSLSMAILLLTGTSRSTLMAFSSATTIFRVGTEVFVEKSQRGLLEERGM